MSQFSGCIAPFLRVSKNPDKIGQEKVWKMISLNWSNSLFDWIEVQWKMMSMKFFWRQIQNVYNLIGIIFFPNNFALLNDVFILEALKIFIICTICTIIVSILFRCKNKMWNKAKDVQCFQSLIIFFAGVCSNQNLLDYSLK